MTTVARPPPPRASGVRSAALTSPQASARIITPEPRSAVQYQNEDRARVDRGAAAIVRERSSNSSVCRLQKPSK